MLQGHTMAIVPCGNPTPKKLPTGGGEWPTFRTARAQHTVRPLCQWAYVDSNVSWGVVGAHFYIPILGTTQHDLCWTEACR